MYHPQHVMGIPEIPAEVRAFAEENGVSQYVQPILEMARRVYPDAPLGVLLEGDPEIADDWHIVVEVDVAGYDVPQLAEAQNRWTRGLMEICPSTHICLFRLGMV